MKKEKNEDIKIGLIDKIKLWGFKNSVKVIYFGNGCCNERLFENEMFIQKNRIGMIFEEASCPKEANLLAIQGLITPLNLNILMKVYEEMPSPKIVIALGSCASGGSTFNSYNCIDKLEKYIPVDYYITGCPPGQEGIDALKNDIDKILIGKI